MREKAIAEYHRTLTADKSLTPEFFARLKSAMRASRLLYGERTLGISLRPHFLTRPQYDTLVTASQLVVSAFDKVAAALLANPSLMNQVGLLEREHRLAMIHPGFSCPAVTTRLDAFVSNQEVKFVEYNAENPSSLTDQAALNQVLFEVEALRSFAEHYRLRQFTPEACLLDALLLTYQEWGGLGTPSIAILDWADLATASEFILLRNYFVGQGIPTIICTPDELEYEGSRLRRGDFRIDLVYKRIVIHEFLARFDDTHPLIKAYVNQDVCLINPFRCKMLHKKAAFEFLTDERHKGWFSRLERKTIRLCVPWTRRVTERRTEHLGRSVDLIEEVRKNRAAFILKPNDDYGGRGLFFGNQSSEAEWDDHLATALTNDYVVQEIIDLRTEEFPIFNDDGWSFEQMFVDTNPFIFRGRVDGVMVRLSDSPIVNVTSGGGETGFFVLEDVVR
jgi:hypothetical protein